jgi:hypothetical protein
VDFKVNDEPRMDSTRLSDIHDIKMYRCRVEGRRLDETDFLYEQPLGLVVTEKRSRRTKSMKPSKVKGLTNNMDEGKIGMAFPNIVLFY